MGADTYLDKLEKLGASKQSSRKFVGAECESYLLWLTKPQLAALVDAEVAAAIERCQGAIIAMHTDPLAPQTRSLRYPDEWAHFERFVSESVAAMGALASTTNKEGS